MAAMLHYLDSTMQLTCSAMNAAAEVGGYRARVVSRTVIIPVPSHTEVYKVGGYGAGFQHTRTPGESVWFTPTSLSVQC